MTALEPYLLYIKLALVAALMAGTWYITRDHYEGLMAKQQVERDAKSAKIIAAKDAQILQGGIEHAQNQTLIGDLTGALAAASRVPVHIPTKCDRNAQSGSDPDGASGVFSTGVDAAFGKLQEGVSQLVSRCDQLNIDAIQNNTANR